MPESDEVFPSHEVKVAILEAIMPKLKKVSNEAEVPATFRVVVRVRETEHYDEETEGFWMIRIRVRNTYKPGRKIWRIQALVPKRPETGFCGFHANGDARLEEDGQRWRGQITGWTGLYHTTGSPDWT